MDVLENYDSVEAVNTALQSGEQALTKANLLESSKVSKDSDVLIDRGGIYNGGSFSGATQTGTYGYQGAISDHPNGGGSGNLIVFKATITNTDYTTMLRISQLLVEGGSKKLFIRHGYGVNSITWENWLQVSLTEIV